MKIFILALLCGVTLAKPDGYFRQEYQFKKSSSTFQNNELQTKNEDEGFYSKHGDLDGKVVPKVDQHNEHMEYVNPKVDGVGHVVKTYDDRDLTHEAESAFSKFHSGSNAGQSLYSSYGSTYGSSSGSTYGMKSNLNQIFENVEYDLTSQLQKAITKSQQDSVYSKLTQHEIRLLEQELKANLTRTLQNALHERYGNQGRQGLYTYSIGTSGAYSPNANYYNQELEDLKKKLEENLKKKLHEASETTITHNIYQTSSSHRNFGAVDRRRDSIEVEDLNTGVNTHPTSPKIYPTYNKIDDLTQAPERIGYSSLSHGRSSHTGVNTYSSQPKIYPTYNQIDDSTQAPERISYSAVARGNSPVLPSSNYDSTSYQSGYRSTSNFHRPNIFPETTTQRIIVNPSIRITDVVQNVQNNLYRDLTSELRIFEEKYSSTTYSLTDTRPNFQASLEHFKNELKYNISRAIQKELEKYYGQQEQRGEYVFSVGSSNSANYRIDDLNDLKRQVEENLVKHLEREFKQQEERFNSRTRTTHQDYTHQSPQYTHALTDDTYQRVQTPYYNPTSNSQRTYSSSQSQHTSHTNAVDAPVSTALNPNLQQLKNNVYETLKSQVYEAVRTQDNTYNSQHNLQVLTDEIKNNITKTLEEAVRDYHKTRGTNSGSYTYSLSSSSTFNPTSADLSAVTQQLRADLLRQLTEQMNKHQMSRMQSSSTNYQPARYSSYSSYGSTSSSSFYPNTQIPSGSLSKYNQFNSRPVNSDVLGEDCMQGDQPEEDRNNLDDSQDIYGQMKDPGYNKYELNNFNQQELYDDLQFLTNFQDIAIRKNNEDTDYFGLFSSQDIYNQKAFEEMDNNYLEKLFQAVEAVKPNIINYSDNRKNSLNLNSPNDYEDVEVYLPEDKNDIVDQQIFDPNFEQVGGFGEKVNSEVDYEYLLELLLNDNKNEEINTVLIEDQTKMFNLDESTEAFEENKTQSIQEYLVTLFADKNTTINNQPDVNVSPNESTTEDVGQEKDADKIFFPTEDVLHSLVISKKMQDVTVFPTDGNQRNVTMKNNKLVNSPKGEPKNPDSFTTQRNLQDDKVIFPTD